MAAQSQSAPNATAPATEHSKAYCAKLAKVVTRYLTPEELTEFAATLETFARGITTRRYCPGLTDAAYDAFAAFNLRRA